MKKLSIAMLCFLMNIEGFTQHPFIIHGKIERLSKSNLITIAGSEQFTAPIKEDGSFEIKGEVTDPRFALVFTDSSGADGIWLEKGEYTVSLKEITMPGVKGYLLRIPSLQGPLDARISHGFSQPRYYIKGPTAEETRKLHKQFSLAYIDSILENFPRSPTLPGMIRLSQTYIGDEAVENYLSLLPAEQKNDESSKQLAYYFSRKRKIETEKLFEDFIMKNQEGNNFQLSSIKGKKLILIDFWSSDCFPCRAKHVKLAELYAKFASRGLEIVSVSLDDNKADWLKAIKKDSMNWINVSKLKGWDGQLAVNYFVKSLPYALWLDESLKIIGPELSEKEIEAYLK